MKKTDITREVLKMHEESLNLKVIDDVKSELKNGIPAELQSEIDQLLSKADHLAHKQPSNVVSFISKKLQRELHTFGETELLAAAGGSLSDWFSQPMNFGGAGFIIDIRKVFGTENEVDIYLKPNKNNEEEMHKSLGSYVGQSVQVVVSNNRNILLDAVLYVDASGTAAEGSGKLIAQSNEIDIKGKISISIVVDNKNSD
jgi:hypothetical protein